MNFMYEPIKLFFLACMWGLRPLRKLGIYGTTDEPIYFGPGDTVPWWIDCRYPLDIPLTFGCEVETFWEDGWQKVHVLEHEFEHVLEVNGGGRCVLLVGAPTLIDGRPRQRRPRKARKLELAYSPAT